MGMLPPVLVELKANSGEFMARMGEARHEVAKLGTESAGHMQKFAAFGKAALLGVGAAAVTVGGFSLEMADKFEKSHAKLEAALKGAGSSMEEWKGRVATVDKQMERLGFTNADTEGALGGLVIALHDPAKAMQVMGTAADLARAKNLSLADAGILVAKAMEGQTRPLKALGIDLPINAKNAESLKVAQENVKLATETYNAELIRLHEKHTVTAADEATLKASKDRLTFAQQQVNEAHHAGSMVLDELNKRLGGQSQQYAQTFAGKMQTLRTQVEDLGAKIGMALIPVLERLASGTEAVVNWFERHKTIAAALGVVIGGALVAAVTAYAISMASAAAATIAATWPILAVVAACAAVVVGIYELATHWHAVWNGIKAAVGDAVSFIRDHTLIIVAALAVLFGPLGLIVGAVLAVGTHWREVWHGIESATGDVVGALVQGFHFLLDVWLTVAGGIIDGAAKMFGWVPGLGGKLKGAAKAFDDFRGAVDAKLTDIANQAYGWGSSVGGHLGDGVVAGLSSRDVPVVTAASGLAAKAVAAIKAKARVQSPSKETEYIGRMLAEGLIQGFTGHAAQVENKLSQGMQDMLDALHKRVQAAIDRMKAAADKAKQQLASDQQARAQMISSTSGQLEGYASLGNAVSDIAPTQDAIRAQYAAQTTAAIAAIERQYAPKIETAKAAGDDTKVQSLLDEMANAEQTKRDDLTSQMNDAMTAALGKPTDLLSAMSGRLQTLQTLHTDLSQLSAQGLNPEIMTQLTSMNADQAVAVATQILNGPQGAVAQLNNMQTQIDAASTQSATMVANATWGNSIAADTKNLTHILAENKKHTAVLEHLAHAIGLTVAEAMKSPGAAKALRNELLRLKKSSGMSLGLA